MAANSSAKDSFDLSFYEDDPVEEVDMLEKKTVRMNQIMYE